MQIIIPGCDELKALDACNEEDDHSEDVVVGNSPCWKGPRTVPVICAGVLCDVAARFLVMEPFDNRSLLLPHITFGPDWFRLGRISANAV
jgi:hypothetical protein